MNIFRVYISKCPLISWVPRTKSFSWSLIAILENKGLVPLKIRNFSFKLLGLKVTDPFDYLGGKEIRGQLRFPHVLEEGAFLPPDWELFLCLSRRKDQYNYIASIPQDVSYVRVQGDFEYLRTGTTHHAAKVLKVSNPALQSTR